MVYIWSNSPIEMRSQFGLPQGPCFRRRFGSVKRQYVVEQDPTRNQRLLVVAVGRFGQVGVSWSFPTWG